MTEHREHRYTDRILIRSKDVALIMGIITLAGTVYAMAKHPWQWDIAAQSVNEMKPIVYQTKDRVDVLEAHFSDILRHLDSIDRKLDK